MMGACPAWAGFRVSKVFSIQSALAIVDRNCETLMSLLCFLIDSNRYFERFYMPVPNKTDILMAQGQLIVEEITKHMSDDTLMFSPNNLVHDWLRRAREYIGDYNNEFFKETIGEDNSEWPVSTEGMRYSVAKTMQALKIVKMFP